MRDDVGWSLSGTKEYVKTGRGRLRKNSWNCICLRNKTVIYKVSACGGGRLREVVAMRELTVV